MTALAGAELVVSASLTAIECNRMLRRAVASGSLSEAEASRRRGLFRLLPGRTAGE